MFIVETGTVIVSLNDLTTQTTKRSKRLRKESKGTIFGEIALMTDKEARMFAQKIVSSACT